MVDFAPNWENGNGIRSPDCIGQDWVAGLCFVRFGVQILDQSEEIVANF